MSEAREFRDGREDGLVALESLDLDRVDVLRRPPAGDVEDRVRRPLARGGARRHRGHGEGPRLQGGPHPLGSHDHRQDGQGHLQDDRHGDGPGRRLDRRPHGPRDVRGGGAHPLPPRPGDVGRGALREGLQPRLRHVGDGGEPQLRGGVHLEGLRPPDRRDGALERDPQPRAGTGPGRGPRRLGRPAERLPEGGPRVRPRLHGLRAGVRPRDLGHEEDLVPRRRRPDGALRPRAPLQPVPRPEQLREVHPRGEAARDLHDRRRRPPQLGAGGGALHRHHQPPPRPRPRAHALHLRRAHLPRARPLGRPLRLHVLGGRVLGQVRPAGRGGALRGGVRGRDHGVAAARQGRLEEIGLS
jgi:hypothetical protein